MCGIVGYIGKKNALPILIEVLKRLNHSAAIYNANVHLYFSHDGKDLRDEPRREMDRIEEHIERNQERLRGLVTELCKPPAPATV